MDRMLKLLSDIDQQIAEAEALVREFPEDDTGRERAREQLRELRAAIVRVEELIEKSSGRKGGLE